MSKVSLALIRAQKLLGIPSPDAKAVETDEQC